MKRRGFAIAGRWGGGWLDGLSLAAACLFALLAAAPAAAQTAREDSVQYRPRPDFDPQGVYLNDLIDGMGRVIGVVPKDQPRSDAGSGVTVWPRLQFSTYYDDNVLRAPSNPKGDFVQTARAAVDVSSDRDSHGFQLGGFAEAGYFSRFVSENYHQYGGYIGGFVIPTDESRAELKLSDERLRQPREETGAGISQLRPTVYHLLTATAKGDYHNADWQLAPSGSFKRYNYEANAPVVLGNELDHDEWVGTFRIAHSVSQGSAVFIEPQINSRTYRQTVSAADGFRHDSSGYQVLGGARFDFSSVTFAEIAAGWLEQSYVDPAFPHLSGPTFAASAAWNPRDWISLALNAGRQINESVLAGVSGVDTTFVEGTLDYEIDYDWLANAKLGYTDAAYRGNVGSTSRTDDILRYGLGTRYFVSRRLTLDLSWLTYDRHSTQAGAGLNFDQYMATVGVQW